MKTLIPLSIRRALGTRWDRWNGARNKNRLLQELGGTGAVCNVCQWEGARFTDDCWHPGTICPNCRSQVRHRLLVACLDGRAENFPGEESLLKGKAVLHFAPERHLTDRIRAAASSYVTADYARGDCDVRLDISAMPDIASESFEAVVVCDVLEHVTDDHAAFREIHRILKPGGTAVLTVPQKDSPATTDEDPSVTSEEGRTARFGQKDHVRMYGDDFASRVAAAGFLVEVLDYSSFSPELIKRFVLHPPVLNPSPLATNHRRIYFARK